jgi:hypothetical protein
VVPSKSAASRGCATLKDIFHILFQATLAAGGVIAAR